MTSWNWETGDISIQRPETTTYTKPFGESGSEDVYVPPSRQQPMRQFGETSRPSPKAITIESDEDEYVSPSQQQLMRQFEEPSRPYYQSSATIESDEDEDEYEPPLRQQPTRQFEEPDRPQQLFQDWTDANPIIIKSEEDEEDEYYDPQASRPSSQQRPISSSSVVSFMPPKPAPIPQPIPSPDKPKKDKEAKKLKKQLKKQQKKQQKKQSKASIAPVALPSLVKEEGAISQYSADRVLRYIASQENLNERPKRALLALMEKKIQSGSLMHRFLVYVIQMKSIARDYNENQIFNTFLDNELRPELADRPSPDDRRVFTIRLIKFLRTLVSVPKISLMHTIFVQGNKFPILDSRLGYPKHDAPVGALSTIYSTAMFLERTTQSSSPEAKEFVIAMQTFFATCMSLAMSHTTNFVATDFSLRSAIAFRPAELLSAKVAADLTKAYHFATLYSVVKHFAFRVPNTKIKRPDKEINVDLINLYKYLTSTPSNMTQDDKIINIDQPRELSAVLVALPAVIVNVIAYND